MEKEQKKRLFGTDGVRGRANVYPMTPEVALALGRAAGRVFRRHEGEHRVVIGKDTRLSCYVFENALISGLCSLGVNTLVVGPLPTPGVAFITRAYRADAGIMISASHNPYYDNGIKFFTPDGCKLSDEVEREIEELVAKDAYDDILPPPDRIGKNSKVIDAYGRYIEFVKATLPRRFTLRRMKIVVDCANGAMYKVAPLTFQELDADIVVINDNPDGRNINDGCGSLHTEQLQQIVVQQNADVGIAFDGDGDRVIMVDERGAVVDGDDIMAVCAKEMKKRGELHSNSLVVTVMSNYGLLRCLQSLDINAITSTVGDRYVLQKMLEHECVLGGEQSGHIIFRDYNTTGDGLVTALQVLRVMRDTEQPLSSLASIVDRCPQILCNIDVAVKPPLEELSTLQEKIREVDVALGDRGRTLVRYSGTENICRVMVEGYEDTTIRQMAKDLSDIITQEIGRS